MEGILPIVVICIIFAIIFCIIGAASNPQDGTQNLIAKTRPTKELTPDTYTVFNIEPLPSDLHAFSFKVISSNPVDVHLVSETGLRQWEKAKDFSYYTTDKAVTYRSHTLKLDPGRLYYIIVSNRSKIDTAIVSVCGTIYSGWGW